MDYSNFDPADGDWEEDFSSELNWGESQWRHYLKGSENDTSRYLSLYNSLKNNPNHLDEVASLMGWDSHDLAMTDDEQGSSSVKIVSQTPPQSSMILRGAFYSASPSRT